MMMHSYKRINTQEQTRHTRYHGLLLALLASFAAGFITSYSEVMIKAWSALRLSFENRATAPRLKSPLELIGVLFRARLKLESELLSDYGRYYGLIFDRDALETAFVMNPLSKERLLRRMMLKILQARNKPDQTSTFTWITAGDSAAAAHGNLFSQSYTAVLDSTVKEAFETLGIKFIAKNYAMGGYVSSPELAMCMESVFGSDMDILMWDFGMMETDDRSTLWCSRAAAHPTKPILMVVDFSDSYRWNNQFLASEQHGMGTILFDQSQNGLGRIRAKIPDSVLDGRAMNDTIPSTLLYYRCLDSIEGAVPCNDPMRHNICNLDQETAEICIREKFKTKHRCADANKYQQSWHPGWKDNYLKGRLLGFFLVEMLNYATIRLDALIYASGQEAVWDFLVSMDEADIKLAKDSPPLLGKAWEPYQDTLLDVGPNFLYKASAICHTALLPAQERYDGILTETGTKGTPETGEYDRGISRYFVHSPDGKLTLAFDPNDRQKCDALEIDHKDYFWVREGDGWLSTTVPNNSEIAAYRRGNTQQSEGLIMVCLKICPLKRCPDDVIGFGPLKRRTNKVNIRVDDRPVIDVKKFAECHFLVGEQGIRWGPGKAGNGQYKISFLVNDKEKTNMRISSIIVI